MMRHLVVGAKLGAECTLPARRRHRRRGRNDCPNNELLEGTEYLKTRSLRGFKRVDNNRANIHHQQATMVVVAVKEIYSFQ